MTTNTRTNPAQTPEGYHWYFAYGSNNSYEQLLRRLGNISPTYFSDNASAEKTEGIPNFGGVHNQCANADIYPPLAMKVVLVPEYFFVIDAPSAKKGLGYANLKKRKVENEESKFSSLLTEKAPANSGKLLNLSALKADRSASTGGADEVLPCSQHPDDDLRGAEELGARVPYVVAVAYLLSDSQLKMMDKFENAPDKYHREAVKGFVLGDVDPMPAWHRSHGAGSTTATTTSASTSAANSELNKKETAKEDDANSGLVCVSRPSAAQHLGAIEAFADCYTKGASVFASACNCGGSVESEADLDASCSSCSSTAATYHVSKKGLTELVAAYERLCQRNHNGVGMGAGPRAPSEDAAGEDGSAMVIEGVAYIYEGEGLLHTDVVGDAQQQHQHEHQQHQIHEHGGQGQGQHRLLKQPSASYMGRILEGVDLYAASRGGVAGLRGRLEYLSDGAPFTSLASVLRSLLISNNDASSSSASVTGTAHEDAARKTEAEENDKEDAGKADVKSSERRDAISFLADMLIAAYTHYLRSIEVSAIISPRAVLRAEGKV